jgi:hypothetical protein
MNKLHFQNDLFNGWEEDGEPMGETLRKSSYEPHALEIIEPKKIDSEKTIFLDPTKYKFNIQTEQQPSMLEKAFYWLVMG